MKDPKTITDSEIIQGCIAQNAAYQNLLYNRYAGKMFAVCLRYANDYASAEDILQNGFIKIFSNLTKFRFEGSFEGWLRRIIVHTAIEYYRKQNHLYTIIETTALANEPNTYEVVSELSAAELMDCVNNLSTGYRTIFNLFAIEGYSHKEIAEMLNISEGTSKSQLARARYLLQKMILKNTQPNHNTAINSD